MQDDITKRAALQFALSQRIKKAMELADELAELLERLGPCPLCGADGWSHAADCLARRAAAARPADQGQEVRVDDLVVLFWTWLAEPAADEEEDREAARVAEERLRDRLAAALWGEGGDDGGRFEDARLDAIATILRGERATVRPDEGLAAPTPAAE